jgi:hypothetical protein
MSDGVMKARTGRSGRLITRSLNGSRPTSRLAASTTNTW